MSSSPITVTPTDLKAIADAGGWVFATLMVSASSFMIIRWLLRLVENQTAAIKDLTSAVDRLTDEVRARRR